MKLPLDFIKLKTLYPLGKSVLGVVIIAMRLQRLVSTIRQVKNVKNQNASIFLM